MSMLGVREPALLAQIRDWTDSAEQALRSSPRFADVTPLGGCGSALGSMGSTVSSDR